MLLVAGLVLLAAFVLVEMRVAHPLLPLRIVLNRFRGGAYLAIGLSAIGVFGIFLFLTYYLQLTLAYSPVKSGLAFLPMIAAIVAASTTSSGVLTALLNTLAASALTSYLVTHGRGPLVLAQAAVHSYVVAFWISAAILAGSAVVCGLVLPSGTLALATGPAARPAAVTREEMSVQ